MASKLASVTPSDWQRFRSTCDPLDSSHRGLHRHLIPQWLKSPQSLNAEIENSAYGETPYEHLASALSAVKPQAGETILDLGSGAGNLCAYFASLGLKAVGLERNPELHQLAVSFQQYLPGLTWEAHLADFLQHPWPKAQLAFLASARFTPSVLAVLGQKLSQAGTFRAVLCLGRPLPLPEPEWRTQRLAQNQIRWNPGEQPLPETFYLHTPNLLKAPSGCI